MISFPVKFNWQWESYRRQDLFVRKVIPENIEKWKSNAVNVKLLVKIFFPHVEKYLKDNKHNSLHLAQIILVYLSVNNICSLNLTVFLKLCFLKTTICAYFGIKWRPSFIYLRLIDIYIYVCVYFNIHNENTLHLNIYKLSNNFNVEIQLS